MLAPDAVVLFVIRVLKILVDSRFVSKNPTAENLFLKINNITLVSLFYSEIATWIRNRLINLALVENIFHEFILRFLQWTAN